MTMPSDIEGLIYMYQNRIRVARTNLQDTSVVLEQIERCKRIIKDREAAIARLQKSIDPDDLYDTIETSKAKIKELKAQLVIVKDEHKLEQLMRLAARINKLKEEMNADDD